ncbi:MAG: hypothetical protein J5J00_17095 [Deltaproteobacteria bacterium]|nr:hypothetical protein [Deltaproteobacteria bacterium]
MHNFSVKKTAETALWIETHNELRTSRTILCIVTGSWHCRQRKQQARSGTGASESEFKENENKKNKVETHAPREHVA